MSDKSDPRTTARVTVEVDVYLAQPWPPETTVQQVFEQAKRDALLRVRAAIDAGDHEAMSIRSAKVTAILTPVGG